MEYQIVKAEELKKIKTLNKKIYAVIPFERGGDMFKWHDFLIVYKERKLISFLMRLI